MSDQIRSAPAVGKTAEKMKLRFHLYPDARPTTMRRYRSAWSRRWGRPVR